MSDVKKKIIIFDLNDTVILEEPFMLILKRRVERLMEKSDKMEEIAKYGANTKKTLVDNIIKELKDAFRECKDDWDNDFAFGVEHAKTLLGLFGNDRGRYMSALREVDQEMKLLTSKLLSNSAYVGMENTIKKLKQSGHKVVCVTDSTATLVQNSSLGHIRQLFNKVYCAKPSSHMKPLRDIRGNVVSHNNVKTLPPGFWKPKGRIVAQAILDMVKLEHSEMSDNIGDYFTFNTSGLASAAELTVKEGGYQAVLQEACHRTIGIGDSNRDILMHKRAGIASIKVDFSSQENPGLKTVIDLEEKRRGGYLDSKIRDLLDEKKISDVCGWSDGQFKECNLSIDEEKALKSYNFSHVVQNPRGLIDAIDQVRRPYALPDSPVRSKISCTIFIGEDEQEELSSVNPDGAASAVPVRSECTINFNPTVSCTILIGGDDLGESSSVNPDGAASAVPVTNECTINFNPTASGTIFIGEDEQEELSSFIPDGAASSNLNCIEHIQFNDHEKTTHCF